MSRLRVATTWLDGCSGCHMSFLDMDEKLLELSEKIELVYSPLIDCKIIPENIDIALIEGAVSSESDREEALSLRSRSKFLISFGDCAVTANVPGMRNRFSVKEVMHRAYVENAASENIFPSKEIPRLIAYARPVHEYVPVDLFLPGCPPPAEIIVLALNELIEGRVPNPTGGTRFGA
jgi:NAD-reducing hydrogenase small subunit